MSSFKTLSKSFTWKAKKVNWPVTSEVGSGLSGAIACTSKIGWIDPTTGGLSYCGIPISDIANKLTFEQVAFLLTRGQLPVTSKREFTSFQKRIRDARNLPLQIAETIRSLPSTTHPTRLLRAGVSALGCYMMSPGEDLTGMRHWQELQIIGQIAQLVAIVARHRKGLKPTLHPENSSIVESLFFALNDRLPNEDEIKLFDLVLVLYADHGLDAPTFTSMVVGSCLADPYYNIVAGLSALRGPLLGGTGERVLKQLLELRDVNVARSWAKGMLSQGWYIPGFGHRIYKQADPRVDILKDKVKQMADAQGKRELFKLFQAVEDEVSKVLSPKGIYVNINFYAALIFHLLGSDPELVPCLYAVGRTAGMVARVREYLDNNRIFRPLERYVGQSERSYIARDDR